MQDGNDRQLQLQPMPSTSFSRAVQDYRAHCFADSFRETFGEQAIRGSNVISSAEEDESDDEVVVVESTIAEVPEWFLAKGKVPFHRKPIQAGRECIVLALTPSRKWSPAKILGIIHNVRNKENRCAVVFSGLEIVRDNVPVSEIAYAEECPNLIPVGTSVVSNVLAESPTRFYAGIVIEAPSHSNRYRYLVCFESGAFSYANHNDLRVTCSHFSPRISRNESKLIRKIMSSAAHREQMNRVLLRFKIGEITELLHNGNYEPGTVVAKDCSLVEIRIDNRLEWVYRGSHRFKAMLTTSLRLPGTRPRFGMLHGTQNQAMIGWRGSQSPPNEQPVVLSSTKNKVEPLKLVTPLFVYGCVPKKKGFHRCDESCVVSADIIATIPKHYGPLLKPLCIGFERPRHPVTGPRRYIAPCGRVITNVEQLTSFLEETKVDFTHENFHFSSDIDVQRVYEPRNVLVSIADLSNGLEKCAISCVNEVSDTLPCENFTYETERSFAHGPAELMNTDGNFVSCCSCEDDCSDYLKCECRQLTINSSCETNDPNIPLGYKYGRLQNLVRTGIYECNARCPCSAKCQNRVAQLPLRNQLQVFFAGKKGWGVRTLHDLPKGTFVCAYVGKLMTEKEANEWGSLHGDEYFADLDFIKARESGKPGYEEEAYEPEPDPAPESSAPARPTRKRRNRNTAPCPPKRKKRKRKLAAFPPDSIRRFYQPGREEFVMDAKTNGNIGRFFNHSCAPNMFVQNVFVDTHDLRFPWVAFFTQRDVSAGEELTWDYNYTVGSVRGKRLDCYCLAPNCKFRLY